MRRSCRRSRSGEGIRRERHRDRGDEGLRARPVGDLDRFGSRHDQRPRSRRRRRRSAARAERRRRRSQHDGHRRGVRRARAPDLDQHVLPVLRLEGACGASPSAIRSGSRRWPSPDGWLERRPRPRSDDARDGRQFRDAHQRRDAHGQRRLHDLRRHGAPADHRRLVSAADAVAHEVDDGGQSRPALRPRHAHAVGGDLRQRLHVRVRPGPRAARERRRSRRSSSAAAAACTRRSPRPATAPAHGVSVGVVDMPSIDEALLVGSTSRAGSLCLAEQNNGYILQNLLQVLFRRRKPCAGRRRARSCRSTRSTPTAARDSSIRAHTRS